jgi:hypothetical protein
MALILTSLIVLGIGTGALNPLKASEHNFSGLLG